MGSRKPKNLRTLADTAIARKDFAAARGYLEKLDSAGPSDPDVLNDLAALYHRLGTPFEQQIAVLERALAADPSHRKAKENLIKVLLVAAKTHASSGDFPAAVTVQERLLGLSPGHWDVHHDLGLYLFKSGRTDEAILQFTKAANLNGQATPPFIGLGLAFMEKHLLTEAKGAFQRVLELDPKSAAAFNGLGLLANRMGVSDVAVNMFRRVLEVLPDSGEAHNNLGLVLRSQGEVDLAYEHYQKGKAASPGNVEIHSGLMLTLNYMTGVSAEEIFRQHRTSDIIFPALQRPLPDTLRDPSRPLKIGYLSPDFRTHSVAYFITAVLAAHDREQYRIHCYYTGNKVDEVTRQIERSVERFVPCYKDPDDVLAGKIQADGIDVLVELSGHTGEHRLAMLRNRVAPVQVTYLGYPNTTGLASMDLRITDDIADPVDVSDRFYTERLFRVDGGFLAYEPPPAAKNLGISPLPALAGKGITFGCFNNLAKVNDPLVELWARILNKVPDSRLVLKARGMRDERVKRRLQEGFSRQGVDPSRIFLNGHDLFPKEHLARYGEIDLALDTYPYSGTTTTCEALWMGVPVITLAGERHAGRVGASLLSRVGLEDCIATGPEDYVERVLAMIADLPRLAQLREGLRQRLQASPLMDAPRMARGLEHAYRQSWQLYCSPLAKTA